MTEKPIAVTSLNWSERPCRGCGGARGRWDKDSDKDCPSYGRRVRRRVLIAGICVVAVILVLLAWVWTIERIGAGEPFVCPVERGQNIEQGVSA